MTRPPLPAAMRFPILARGSALAATLALLPLAAAPLAGGRLGAQDRLIGQRPAAVSPFFELWSFGDALPQPLLTGGAAQLERVTQLSVPVSAVVPIGERFTIDVSGGFATGEVSLAQAVGPTGRETDAWSLSGPMDTKVRLTGRLAGDNVVFTLGANAPTGGTDLDDEQYAAARVLSAPALALRVPVLGNGAAYTAGMVAAREVGRVSLALGASYEARTSFSPVGLVAGLPATEYNPSDAVRVSLMGEALVGEGQMSAGISVDAFSRGEIRNGTGSSATTSTLQLGPVITAEWHWRLAAPRFRALSLSVVDRYRTAYQRDGATVDRSAGNYLDVVTQGLLPIGGHTDLVLGVDARHHTGLDSDDSIAAAALASGGLTVGLSRTVAGGLQVQPLARVQFGRIESGGVSSNMTGVGAGIVVGRRF